MSIIPDWVKGIPALLGRTARPTTGIVPVAVATVDLMDWALVHSPAQKVFCLIPVDPALREGNTLEIPDDHMQELAQLQGTCMNRKKVKELMQGKHQEDWPPRTYLMTKDLTEGCSYALRMTELVAWAKKQLETIKAAMKEQTDAAQAATQASGAGGPVDAGRAPAPAPSGGEEGASAPG